MRNLLSTSTGILLLFSTVFFGLIMIGLISNNSEAKNIDEFKEFEIKLYKADCKIDSVISINDSLQNVITELSRSIKIPVTATMYHPVVGQCDDTPDITGDQSKIPDVYDCTKLCWIAVSQDLLWFNGGPFRYGDKVLIMNAGHKDGVYTVRDAMNKRAKNKIDFLESIGSKPYKYKNVLITRIDNS